MQNDFKMMLERGRIIDMIGGKRWAERTYKWIIMNEKDFNKNFKNYDFFNIMNHNCIQIMRN